MRDRLRADLARRLGDAWNGAFAIPAPSTLDPTLTADDAYAIQEMIIAERVGQSRRRAGWKLGLTSAGPQATPIVGTLLDDMVVPSGTELAMAGMVAPMVEAEVVVRIGEDIARPHTVEELAAGPHMVGPGIEVIDYRTTDSTGVIDWIADNSTVAYAVVGTLVPAGDVDPVAIEASLSADGRHLATGRGDKVMGNPMAAVAWLTGHLSARGHLLEEGHVVLTGSLTGHHRVVAPDQVAFAADFGDLGTVTVSFHP